MKQTKKEKLVKLEKLLTSYIIQFDHIKRNTPAPKPFMEMGYSNPFVTQAQNKRDHDKIDSWHDWQKKLWRSHFTRNFRDLVINLEYEILNAYDDFASRVLQKYEELTVNRGHHPADPEDLSNI